MRHYPIYLDIEGKKCVVIGGGKVAERKVASLLNAGAKVRVISPVVTAALEKAAGERKISLSKRQYRKGDLRKVLLAYAATDDVSTNIRVFLEAREKGVLLNVVDNPESSHFIVPSVVERGRLSIAISTGGTSPAFAKNLRIEMEERYGDEYAAFLDIMAAIRQKLLTKGSGSDKNRKLFNKLASSSMPEMIKNGRWKEVDKIITSLLGEEFSLTSLGIKKGR